MNLRLKAYTTSFFIHILFFLAVILFLGNQVEHKRVIEIDLTLNYPKEEIQVQKKSLVQEEKRRERKVQTALAPAIRNKEQTSEVKEEPKENLSDKFLDETQNTVQPALNGASENRKEEGKTLSSNTGSGKGSEETKEGIKNDEKKQAQELYLREKLSVISSLVQKNISYPPIARRMGWEGKVVVCFVLTADGSIKNMHIERSSSYDVLDNNAVDTIKRLAHLFPKPHVEVVIKLPVNYRLSE